MPRLRPTIFAKSTLRLSNEMPRAPASVRSLRTKLPFSRMPAAKRGSFSVRSEIGNPIGIRSSVTPITSGLLTPRSQPGTIIHASKAAPMTASRSRSARIWSSEN